MSKLFRVFVLSVALLISSSCQREETWKQISPDTFAQEEAIRLLVEECGNNLPFCGKETASGMERIRFAALKLSGGKLSELRRAVETAKQHWRDILVAAGFGNSTTVHNDWWPDTN